MRIQIDFGLALLLTVGVYLELIDFFFALIIYLVFTAIFTCFAFVMLKVVGTKVAKLVEVKKDEAKV